MASKKQIEREIADYVKKEGVCCSDNYPSVMAELIYETAREAEEIRFNILCDLLMTRKSVGECGKH
ncbi:MAG: hypothetical protein ACRDBQ_15050 [Shewanella sp.]